MIVIPHLILTVVTLVVFWLLQIGQERTPNHISHHEFVTGLGAVVVVAIGSAIIGWYQQRQLERELSEWEELNW